METLKKSSDYRKAVGGGNRETLGTIVAYRRPNKTGVTRIGISVTKKSGNSVKRNRTKRRIREAIRRNASLLPPGEDIVIVARPKCGGAVFVELEEDIRRIGKGINK